MGEFGEHERTDKETEKEQLAKKITEESRGSLPVKKVEILDKRGQEVKGGSERAPAMWKGGHTDPKVKTA